MLLSLNFRDFAWECETLSPSIIGLFLLSFHTLVPTITPNAFFS